MKNIYFVVYYSFLLLYANYMDIGDIEIKSLYHHDFFSFFENIWLSFFPHNNIFFRLPSILLSMISLILYYKISKKYLKKQEDVFLATMIFSLMPGFIIASLLFNKSIYLIFFVLLFIYTFFYYRFFSYIFLVLFTIIDSSFISLYLGLVFYSIYKKDTKFLIFSVILLGINANYFNYEIHGHPKGHFLDILIVYFAIFSPFVFIYFIYSLIKIFKKPTLLWFISISGLLFSILLSFRQKIKIDDFAPYVIVAVIFMVYVFLLDYRIRLKIFRNKFRQLFTFLFGSLILFDIVLFSSIFWVNNKNFYQFRNTYILAQYLIKNNIGVKCIDNVLCKKLYFYGVKKKDNLLIYDFYNKKVSISHNDKKILQFYITKLNK